MAFDGNAYRKRVLAPLAAASGGAGDADAFTLFDLPPEADDDAVIARQIADVTAFWQKERSRPKYRGLVEALLADRERLTAELTDPARRARARTAATEAGEQAARERMARVDRAIATLRREFGGIPTSRMDRLREVARRSGVEEAALAERLAREQVIDDGGGTAEVLPASVRRQIATTLTELARIRGTSADGGTLFTVLDLPPTASEAQIRARREELARRNRQRAHGREKTLEGEALALVELHLLERDRGAYLNGLVDDAKDRLRADVHDACLLSDRLDAADFDRFTREGVSRGLTADAARRVVAELAQEVGAPVETGRAVDYVVCPGCGSAEPDDGREVCRRCGTALHRACPSCHQQVRADVLVCPNCGADLRALEAADELVRRAREELGARRATAARATATEALELVSGHDTAQAVRRDADAALRRAGQAWREALAALADGRPEDAAGRLGDVVGTAVDAPGPGGEDATALARRAADQAAHVRRAVDAALRGSAAEREAALLTVLDDFPGNATVRAELARIPPPPPRDVHARDAGTDVAIRWASGGRGPAGEETYVVIRMRERPEGGLVRDRVVGRTQQTAIEDGAPLVGVASAYAVEATRGSAASEPAISDTLVVLREVTHLAAEGREGEVALRWRGPPGGAIQLERVEVASDGGAGPTRRIRPDEDGYVDTHVRNGTTYEYTVYVEPRPRPRSGPTRTPGITVTARPRSRLAPIRNLVAAETAADGAVRLTFHPPSRGESRVLRCAPGADPPAAGTALGTVELDALGPALTEIAPGTVVDERPAPGITTYLPVTIEGPDAVAGRALAQLAVPPVQGVTADDRGEEIVLRWQWPYGCTEALVCWRRDRFADGPADPQAESVKVTNTRYEMGDGWTIPAEPAGRGGPYFLSVHAGARVDGDLIWAPDAGPGGRLRVREPVRRVRWQASVRRSGWRKRVVAVDLIVEGPTPELIVVAREGDRQPAGREDGVRLGVIDPTPQGGQRTVELPLGGIGQPATVAVFCADPAYDLVVAIEGPVGAGSRL